MILYCFHNLVFSTVSQELVEERWELLVPNHPLEWTEHMLGAEVIQ